MFPKVSAALSRFLAPIRPIDRPGESLKPSESADGGEGGYTPPHADARQNPEEKDAAPDSSVPEPMLKATSGAEREDPAHPESTARFRAFQPGLTQVILDIFQKRKGLQNSSGVVQYENGTREQKSGVRLPKGSMLDKKAG